MALAKHKPTSPSRVTPHDASVVADPKMHEIYDHRTTPLWSLDAFLQGSPWQVTYFRQKLGKGDPPKKLDIESPPGYQSYECFEKLELLVQSAITPSYKDREGLMEVTGSALTWSFMTPNVDDYFIAQSNLAKLGLFRVTNINRRQHERESVYIVEYMLEEEITEDHILYMDLFRKITSTFVFDKQRLIENKNPILTKRTYAQLKDLHFVFLDLVRQYFRDFFNVQTMTLQIPGQIGRHVDPYVLDFLLKIVPMSEAPMLSKIRFISLNNESSYTQPVLWNVLTNRQHSELSYALRKMGKVNPRQLKTAFFANSGNFANADYVVRPLSGDVSLASHSYETSICESIPAIGSLSLTETKNHKGEIPLPTEILYTDLPNALPGYLSVESTESYIFQDSFYDSVPNTVLEIMVLDYLRHQPINLNQLAFVVDLYKDMPRVEQFYYGPILMLLLKEAERGAYA